MPLFQQPFMSGGFPSMNRAVVAATEFTSMYESFNPLTTVNKQHFVEWFSGNAIDSIWTTGGTGTPTFAMQDVVDGGYKITPNSSLDAGAITFNDKRQYNYNASVCIAVTFKVSTGGRYRVGLGESADITLGTIDKSTAVDGVGTYIYLETANGTSSNDTDSTVSANTTTEHSHKIENKASTVELTIDGTLEVTNSTELPLTKLQPVFLARAGASSQESAIRYMECYNT